MCEQVYQWCLPAWQHAMVVYFSCVFYGSLCLHWGAFDPPPGTRIDAFEYWDPLILSLGSRLSFQNFEILSSWESLPPKQVVFLVPLFGGARCRHWRWKGLFLASFPVVHPVPRRWEQCPTSASTILYRTFGGCSFGAAVGGFLGVSWCGGLPTGCYKGLLQASSWVLLL